MTARIGALAALLGMLALAVASVAGAGRPAFNPACAGTKIEPVVSGTYALGFDGESGSITIAVSETAQGEVFDFTTDAANHVVASVVVKGGPAFAAYDLGSNAGTALHAPHNPKSGKWYGLSHLCFTTDSPGDEDDGGGEF
jgi:hypothetical protein